MLQWGVVAAGDIIVVKGGTEEAELLPNGHVTYQGEEMSMQKWLRRMTGWQSVETYTFAIHKETGKSLSQICREYMDDNGE